MEKEILEKWREIYYYLSLIVDMDPWYRFEEKDIFAFCPKGKKEEHFFSFLYESCGCRAIAFYRSGTAYSYAREKLHGKNTKKEPVFLLQDAVILKLGDRKDVKKYNYSLIKDLEIQCRGRGCWPYFEKYRVGYMPITIPEDELDELLDDVGNLWVMVQMIVEGRVFVDFEHQEVMTRSYSADTDMFYSYPSKLKKKFEVKYPVVTMEDNEWLDNLRNQPSKGTISLDWSYLPTAIRDEGVDIVPRGLIAVENKDGFILKTTMLCPNGSPHDDLLDELFDLIEKRGKPAVIEICDKEIESYISDLCRCVKIRLEYKQQLKLINSVRRKMLKG